MAQLENIEAIERRLWGSADNLRANSNYASNEYFMPVMGLIFLRHAYSRYLAIKPEIEASLPSRSGQTRPLTKEDFSRKSAIFLKPEAQFDYLVNLSDADDRAQAIIDAMEAIEADYETLQGVLPKSEYQELDNDVLGNLFRTFNDPALKNATGDIFGRIYEYFLTQFADQKAHDGGEFFTPVSLVQMIVNVIEPDHGDVIDPACGSGGMFVQSAHFIEHLHKSPQDVATFYGMEKNPTTIRLAKMNLAVHGLEGKISKAITYYEDPHDMREKADFVMANPPFNVDDVDAGKIKTDPRLPFGLPGVNKKGAVSNGSRHLPARVNQHVMIMRPIDVAVCSEYLLCAINYPTQKQLILSIAGAGGATREALTKNTIATLELLIPERHFMEEFRIFATDIFRQIETVQTHNLALTQTRDLLLPKHMNGDIAA